jgi:hypothetical protein
MLRSSKRTLAVDTKGAQDEQQSFIYEAADMMVGTVQTSGLDSRPTLPPPPPPPIPICDGYIAFRQTGGGGRVATQPCRIG